MLLSKKNAVVTGCLRGIGKKTLETFAVQGANVWACAQHKDEEFEKFCAELAQRTGTWIKPVYFDLTDTDTIKAGLKSILSDKQPVDVLVNVAGFTKDAIFHMTSMEQLKLIVEVNYFSQIFITQYITKLMVRQKSGSVINIASISGLDGSPGQLAYSSSKAALIGATALLNFRNVRGSPPSSSSVYTLASIASTVRSTPNEGSTTCGVIGASPSLSMTLRSTPEDCE